MFKKTIVAVITGLMVSVFLSPWPSFSATFELTYRLTEGGNNLEFSADNPFKGVEIQVNSDAAVRYEVAQEIIRPIESRDNPGSNIDSNLVFRAVMGRNAGGTLHGPFSDPGNIIRGRETLYTSDAAGTSDGFTLIYGITGIEMLAPGYYQGQIGFILRPVESNQEQVLKILDVTLNVSKQDAKPRIQISPLNGLSRIILNSKKEGAGSADVEVRLSGGFRDKFELAQTLTKALESNEGVTLDPGVINLTVDSIDKGEPGISSAPLSLRPQVVYTSAFNGDADDQFVIHFNLGDMSGQKAGRYRSIIQYSLNSGQLSQQLEQLEIEVENEPVFDLLVSFANQADRIDFSNLRPKSEPQRNEVILEIKSNVGKQYQVSQRVYSELKDKEGNAISDKNFTQFAEPFDGIKGSLRNLQKSEVKTGETVLFLSDAQGSSDKFKLIYELGFPEEARAGDYSTQITYSLSEL